MKPNQTSPVYPTLGRFRGKPQKNENLRHTLVTIHLDGTHMCIQVTEAFFRFLCTFACYAHVHTDKLLINYQYAHVHTVRIEQLPECSSVFLFFAVFSWMILSHPEVGVWGLGCKRTWPLPPKSIAVVSMKTTPGLICGNGRNNRYSLITLDTHHVSRWIRQLLSLFQEDHGNHCKHLKDQKTLLPKKKENCLKK